MISKHIKDRKFGWEAIDGEAHMVPPLDQIALCQNDIGALLDKGHRLEVKEHLYDWLARELNMADEEDDQMRHEEFARRASR